MAFLVAPSEPKAFNVLGDRSVVPEQYGVDFLAVVKDGKLIGCQRKECADLVASLRDDRLSRELSQVQALDRSVLIVEGAWGWRNDIATRVHGGNGKGSSGFTRAQFDGVMLSCQVNGMLVLHSDGIADTIRQIQQVARFFERDDHDSLFVRPKYRADEWGTAAHRGWAIHLLQSFPGISVVTAAAIYDTVGLPLRWDDDVAEKLRAIPGIGPKRIATLMGAFTSCRVVSPVL